MKFSRNRVRHEVLPLLESLNPAVQSAILRLSEAVRSDDDLLAALALSHLKVEGQVALISRAVWRELSPAMARRAAIEALSAVAGDRREFSARNIAVVQRLAQSGSTGDGCDLPRGLRVDLTRSSLRFRKTVPTASRPFQETSLPVPGRARYGEMIVEASAQAPETAIASVEVDKAAVGSALTVRPRQQGDRLQPAGMRGTKKLQDIFVDGRIPREERDRIPIFVSPRGVAWVGGVRLAGWALPQPEAERLVLSYRLAENSA